MTSNLEPPLYYHLYIWYEARYSDILLSPGARVQGRRPARPRVQQLVTRLSSEPRNSCTGGMIELLWLGVAMLHDIPRDNVLNIRMTRPGVIIARAGNSDVNTATASP